MERQRRRSERLLGPVGAQKRAEAAAAALANLNAAPPSAAPTAAPNARAPAVLRALSPSGDKAIRKVKRPSIRGRQGHRLARRRQIRQASRTLGAGHNRDLGSKSSRSVGTERKAAEWVKLKIVHQSSAMSAALAKSPTVGQTPEQQHRPTMATHTNSTRQASPGPVEAQRGQQQQHQLSNVNPHRQAEGSQANQMSLIKSSSRHHNWHWNEDDKSVTVSHIKLPYLNALQILIHVKQYKLTKQANKITLVPREPRQT